MINITVEESKTKLIYRKYDKDSFVKEEIESIDRFLEDIDDEKVRWLDIVGLSETEVIGGLCEKLKVHPLVVEDILNMDQAPKVEDYEESLFVVVKNIILEEEMQKEQISFILYRDKVISFRYKDTGIFHGIEARLKEGTALRKNGADDLLYALIDIIVDRYFIVMENIGERLDDLEDEILVSPKRSILGEIYLLKRDLIGTRNVLWPMRNTISGISKNEYEIIAGNTIYYFRDVYDNIIQIIDINESYREVASSMLEIYLSSIGNKTNDVMKVLTIYSTIFIPLTFLTGIYGMNFKYMPELYWEYAYLSFWIISIIITIYSVMFFKKKGWI